MPTLLQLRAERWWNEEVVPPAVDWLGDQLCAATDRPRNAFGCKGDTLHMRGSHRSQAWLLNSRYATNRTYTIQAGLTTEQSNWCSGVDFTPGSPTQMIQQCKRIDAALRAGALEEVREFYGNLDGDQIVDGWDNIANRAATSDSSHLWHWHLTLDRRYANTQSVMARILHIVLGDSMPLSQTDLDAIANAVKGVRTGMSGTNPGSTFGQLLLGAAKEAQVASLGAKVDSLLTQVGALTVAVANLQHAVDQLGATTVLTFEPVEINGELRFGQP